MAGARPIGRLPASQRVRHRADFARAKSSGRRVTTAHFVCVLSARLSAETTLPRLGIVASRRIGNAVRRNRAKRLIREAFRATRDLWIPGLDLIVIVTRPLEGMTLDEVVAEWRSEAPRIARRARALLDGARKDQTSGAG